VSDALGTDDDKAAAELFGQLPDSEGMAVLRGSNPAQHTIVSWSSRVAARGRRKRGTGCLEAEPRFKGKRARLRQQRWRTPLGSCSDKDGRRTLSWLATVTMWWGRRSGRT